MTLPKEQTAVLFTQKEPFDFEVVDDYPVPEATGMMAVVQMMDGSVCASDVAYGSQRVKLDFEGKGPLIHEGAGRVVALGPDAKKWGRLEEGQLVSINPVAADLTDEFTRLGRPDLAGVIDVPGVTQGGLACQYVTSHVAYLVPLPEGVTTKQGSFMEPLACGMTAFQNLGVLLGDWVTLVGPGKIGLMVAQVIKAAGGRLIVFGIEDQGLELAKKFGAEIIINTLDKSSPHYLSEDDTLAKLDELHKRQHGGRMVFFTGALPAIHFGFRAMKETSMGRNGRMVTFGLPADDDVWQVPASSRVTGGWELVRAWLAPRESWYLASRALELGIVKLDDIQTHEFPLRECGAAIKAAAKRENGEIGVTVKISD